MDHFVNIAARYLDSFIDLNIVDH